MKYKNKFLSIITLITSSSLIACSTQSINNQSQVIIDPAYNYLSDKSLNKMSIGTLIYFKIDNLSNNKLTGYLLNNIFNIDDNIILFKMGDTIIADYNIEKGNCGLTNVIIKNNSGSIAPITDFYLMKDDITYNCSIKNQKIKQGEIYNLNVTSVSNIPNIGGGVAISNIIEQFIQNQLDTEKQYKIISSSNLNWIPIAVADNGIQTLIKLPSGGGAHLPYAYINRKLIPINSSFTHKSGFDYIVIDGIYSNIVLNNLINESFGEVHIVRSNLPDTQNTIVNNLFINKFKLMQTINQQSQNTMYQPEVSIPTNQNSNQQSKSESGVILYKQNSDNTPITLKQSEQQPPTPDENYSPMGVNIMGKLNFNNQ